MTNFSEKFYIKTNEKILGQNQNRSRGEKLLLTSKLENQNCLEYFEKNDTVIKPSQKSDFKFVPTILKGTVINNFNDHPLCCHKKISITNSKEILETSLVSNLILKRRQSCISKIK